MPHGSLSWLALAKPTAHWQSNAKSPVTSAADLLSIRKNNDLALAVVPRSGLVGEGLLNLIQRIGRRDFLQPQETDYDVNLRNPVLK